MQRLETKWPLCSDLKLSGQLLRSPSDEPGFLNNVVRDEVTRYSKEKLEPQRCNHLCLTALTVGQCFYPFPDFPLPAMDSSCFQICCNSKSHIFVVFPEVLFKKFVGPRIFAPVVAATRSHLFDLIAFWDKCCCFPS